MKFDEIHYWSEVKLDIIKDYASAYSQIMSAQRNPTFRIDQLRRTGARIKFLSLEPLLGPLSEIDLRQIDWVIVGGESGPGARPMNPSWVSSIRDRCQDAGVPFFFKQWGGFRKKKAGREFEGRTWDEMPAAR